MLAASMLLLGRFVTSSNAAIHSPQQLAFVSSPLVSVRKQKVSHPSLGATVPAQKDEAVSNSGGVDEDITSRITAATGDAKAWGEQLGMGDAEVAFYALFDGIRTGAALGLKGKPFYLKQDEILQAMGTAADESSPFDGFFSFDDLAKAVEEDFLDADRGTTNNREGWKVMAVSTPRGSSFEEARMTLDEINTALEKGTVIFNCIGAHIPKLAGATLACTDASSLPCAVNMYVTAPNTRTSAPPHTDRQDVIVVQTQGRKHWRVYTPPEPSLKPWADMYARGKFDDNLPLHLLETPEGGSCELLVDTTLHPGDVLFIPAGFPHTTDTVHDDEDTEKVDTSLHLTFNFDTHVWDLDYLSARRFALRRAGVKDTALGQEREEDNRYVGQANVLPPVVRNDLFEALPLGLLDDSEQAESMVDTVASELERISRAVDDTTASAVPLEVWRDTAERLRVHGMELLDIHRNMYESAIQEGRVRIMEEEMAASLGRTVGTTPERMQRMSLFRVPPYFEQISASKASLAAWSLTGSSSGTAAAKMELPDNWEFTLPLNVGDEVEADLGGAMFPAKVTRVLAGGSAFDVQFFDGDQAQGLDRNMIKLLKPPAMGGDMDEEQPPPGLTPKEIKRWKKKQEKKKNK